MLGIPVSSTLQSAVKQVAISSGQILVAKGNPSVSKVMGGKQVLAQGVAKAIVSGASGMSGQQAAAKAAGGGSGGKSGGQSSNTHLPHQIKCNTFYFCHRVTFKMLLENVFQISRGKCICIVLQAQFVVQFQRCVNRYIFFFLCMSLVMATLQLPANNLANLANLPPGTKLYLTTNSKNPSGKGKLLLIPQGAILRASSASEQCHILYSSF